MNMVKKTISVTGKKISMGRSSRLKMLIHTA